MGNSLISKGLDLWEVDERRLVYLFVGIFLFFASAVVVGAYLADDWKLSLFVSNLMSSFIFTFLIFGFFVTRKFGKMGIIRFKRIFRKMVLISLPFGLVFMAVMAYVIHYLDVNDPGSDPSGAPTEAEWVVVLIALYIGGFIAGLVAMLVGFLVCMGTVGAIYLFMVGMAPLFLRRVRDITSGVHIGARGLAWLFLVPTNLDTGTLHVTSPVWEERFPRARFRNAVAWQVIFSILVAVLVSLNPFLLDVISIEQLFELMNSAHIIVPLLFLPTLVILRLRARIEGPVKDFPLYEGMRSRLVRTFLAIGTIVIFVRMALEEIPLETWFLHFTIYSVVSVTFILAFTFLWFNYFEYELAKRVAERVPELVVNNGMSDGEAAGDDVPDTA